VTNRPPVQDDVWKSAELTRTFLEGVRGGIPYAADQIEIMLRVIEGAGSPVSRFLDLGSGAGALAAAMLSRFPEASAVLVDFSEPMLDAGRSSFPEPPHRLIHADFGEPGWVDAIGPLAPFDVIVSGYAIHHQPDDRKREVFREVFDLLVPGGIFVNVEHVAPASPWISTLNDELFIESILAHHQRIGSGKTREQVAEEYVHRPDKAANILTPVETQCEWLRRIGFQDVDCYFKVFELAVFGGRKPRGRSQ
jgi:ubiquinone/menaquinone biosynthesis C-methylase UbiE